MNPEPTIEKLNFRDPLALNQIAALHIATLPKSPLTALGRRWLALFYYRFVARQPEMVCRIAYSDGKPVAFLLATANANSFLSRAVRKYWLELVGITLHALITNPWRIRAVWECVLVALCRASSGPKECTGEILSLGVLPGYHDAAEPLLLETMAALHRIGLEKISAVLDRENQPEILFYQSLGWRIAKWTVPGWKTPSVEVLYEV